MASNFDLWNKLICRSKDNNLFKWIIHITARDLCNHRFFHILPTSFFKNWPFFRNIMMINDTDKKGKFSITYLEKRPWLYKWPSFSKLWAALHFIKFQHCMLPQWLQNCIFQEECILGRSLQFFLYCMDTFVWSFVAVLSTKSSHGCTVENHDVIVFHPNFSSKYGYKR